MKHRNLNHQMNIKDCYQLTLLSMIEISTNLLISMAEPKSRRYNRLLTISNQITPIDETFNGYLTDTWIELNKKFQEKLQSDFENLLEGYRKEIGI